MEATLLYTVSLIIFLLGLKLFIKPRHGRLNIPPSPAMALPIIGHLHLVKHPFHRILHGFSQKIGPIFSLRFGNRLVVVVSAPWAVEECFTHNDIVFSNRPLNIIGEYIAYNHTSLFDIPYSDHWRNLRKLSADTIFSPSRLNMFLSVRHDEVNRFLQNLYEISSNVVDLQSMLKELYFNLTFRMTTGKRSSYEDNGYDMTKRFGHLVANAMGLFQGIYPGDFVPLLRKMDYKGYESSVKKPSADMDAFLQGLIEEYRHGRSKENENSSMIHHLLSLQETQPDYYTDEVIKGHIILLLLGGTDTTSIPAEWAMCHLLNNPEILNKARDELDMIVGDARLINESDLSKLPYLRNIILETLRLSPPAPLLRRMSSKHDKCKVGGYDVPPDTILFVNVWAIQRDPNIWDDPETFKPERFQGITRDDNTKLMPFGIGRRTCPAEGLAQRMLGLTLGSLIQCFEWQRTGHERVDLTEGQGLTAPKVVPLEAKCKPRNFVHKFMEAPRI